MQILSSEHQTHHIYLKLLNEQDFFLEAVSFPAWSSFKHLQRSTHFSMRSAFLVIYLSCSDDCLRKQIPCDAVYSPCQPRSSRLSVLNPCQLIPHSKHSTRKMAIWRNNVSTQSFLCKILLPQHGFSPRSGLLRTIQCDSQVTFDLHGHDYRIQSGVNSPYLENSRYISHWSNPRFCWKARL